MKKMGLMLCFAVFFGFVFAIGGVSSIYAQESDTGEFELEEITVTAQKRAENSQRVPIQMDVITGEDLLGTEKDNVDDILRDVSNIVINKYDDGMRITLRGQADDIPVAGGIKASSPTVSVNIDGAFTNETAGGQNLFDLERIEVLAGPQSTIYGSNSPGGVVNVVTARPKTDRFEVNASAEFGNYGLLDGQLVVNVPILKDKLAMRLSTKWYERDSWIEGAENSQENKTVRFKTTFQPDSFFDATITLGWSEQSSGGRLNGNVRLFDHEDGVWANEFSDHVRTPVTNPWTTSDWGAPETTGAMSQDAVSKSVQLDLNIDVPFGTITLIPSYSEREAEDLRNDFEVLDADGNTVWTEAYTENFNVQEGADVRIVSSPDFAFKWIIGGTWHDSNRQNN